MINVEAKVNSINKEGNEVMVMATFSSMQTFGQSKDTEIYGVDFWGAVNLRLSMDQFDKYHIGQKVNLAVDL